MGSWNLFETADWGVNRVINFDTNNRFAHAEIDIPTRLLETNKQVQQIEFERIRDLTVDTETAKLVTLRQKYAESVKREKALMDTLEEETNILKKHELAQPNVLNAFTEYRMVVSRCQTISVEQINELTDIEAKYIEKMRIAGDIFIKSQNEKCAKLKDELQAVTHELSVYREVLHEFMKDLIPEEKRKPNTCSICFDKDVNRCLNPCGHSFCDGCSSRLSSTTCPTCRAKVVTVIPLFL